MCEVADVPELNPEWPIAMSHIVETIPAAHPYSPKGESAFRHTRETGWRFGEERALAPNTKLTKCSDLPLGQTWSRSTYVCFSQPELPRAATSNRQVRVARPPTEHCPVRPNHMGNLTCTVVRSPPAGSPVLTTPCSRPPIFQSAIRDYLREAASLQQNNCPSGDLFCPPPEFDRPRSALQERR